MSPAGRSLALALFCGLLASSLCCRDYPRRGSEVLELDLKILKDAESVRTRQGERLGGYLAEYEENFQKQRIFISLEILKYAKGERLTVRGSIADDSVRISYGDQPAADIPVFYVRKAAPTESKLDIEKLVSGPEKKR